MKYLLLLLLSAPAFAGNPACYPPNAVGTTITLSPASYTDWVAAADSAKPYFILTWFCPSSSDPSGYTAGHMVGYRNEILPSWPALLTLSKPAIDAMLTATPQTDPELVPLALAQIAATIPAPLKTVGTTVYYVIQQPDAFVPVPVGTAPLGTVCIRNHSVDGMYGVPVASVSWYGTVKPLAVVAPCG